MPAVTRLVLLFLISSMSIAAMGQTLWLRKAGGNNLDEALDIARVASNNDYYVTGHFSGVANFSIQNLASSGSSDAFLSKYDVNGNPLWAKRFGGNGTDRGAAVATDNSGQSYVCGFFSGTATFGTVTLTADDSSDVFVAKVNTQGDVIWAKRAGGNGNDGAVGIAVDLGGNVIITGQYRGTANFGAINLTSMDYEGGGNPSTDIFTAKLDPNGNWLWVKSGSAGSDERAADVCIDGSNNIYICGQFSGDITFDQLHANSVENAGYVLKYNSSGQEQWFSRVTATLVFPQALRCDSQNNLLITGESIGQIVFFGTNSEIVSTTSSQSIFIAKYTTAGAISWAKEDGSDSYVSSKGIAIGPSNEAYITGLFECVFTEYSDELGPGLFNSAGFRDVFITSYDSNGNRIWMRQYGGPRNEYCGAIALGPSADSPRIAGSFERFFHAPGSAPGFSINNTNFSPEAEDEVADPNGGDPLCGYGNYGSFVHLKSQGNKDIFIGNLVDTDLPHYDYYSREVCSENIVESCIGDQLAPLSCADSVIICGSSQLYINWNTGSNGWIGPQYEWEWNTGSENEEIMADETGWYTVESETLDGCRSQTDSIWVEILEIPEPVISDDEGINVESPPQALDIELCAPDEVELTAGDLGTGDSWWAAPDGSLLENNPITATESGVYTIFTTGENGCVGQNQVEVLLIDPLEEIDPLLQFNDGDQPINDTLVICGNDYITVELIDLLEQETFALYTDAIWQISLDTGYYPEHDGFESYSFLPQVSGWHYINVTPFLFTPEPCIVDTIWYPEQELSVYIELLDTPAPTPFITGGGQPLCPGDTLTLVAGGANSYVWAGPGIIEYVSDNTVLVNEPGNYQVSSFEQFDNGCSATGFSNVTIPGIPQPTIESEPGHGVICPGGSLELVAQDADAYQWIGPLGEDLGDEQSIIVNSPGNYLCEITMGDCVQESNVIEVQLYATPYILALPTLDLCETGMVTLIVQSFPDAVIEWQSPLSGSAGYQNVFEPGTYSVTVDFCNIETEVSVEVILSVPEAVIIASSDILCPGGSITLTANEGMSDYTWSPGGQHTSSILVTQPGTYTVEIENETGCEAESEGYTITSYNINTPNAQNESVCYGETANLFASGQGIFWATDETGLDIVHTGTSFATDPVTESTVYYVFAEDENCTSLGEPVNVSIYASSTLSISATDSTFCAGENLTLTSATGTGFQYFWTLPDGTFDFDANVVLNNMTPEDNGWYFFQGSDIHCDAPLDSIYVTVENPFNESLIAESDAGVCVLSELIVSTDLVSDEYSWTTPLGNFDEAVIIIDEADYDAEGTYTLTVPGVYCATNTDTVHIDVVPYPEIDLLDTAVYCDGGYMIAHLPHGYDIYHWNTGDTDNEAIVPTDGFISVEVINLPGCADSDSIFVENIDCISEFPNIFTPNGDGDNEYVDFGWLRIPIDEVIIFNRWGNEIRRLEEEPFIWNGRTEASELVSDGVYYYVVISGSPGKHFRNLSGYIHVLGLNNSLRN